MSRVALLQQIICFGECRQQAFLALAKLPYDAEPERFVVSNNMLAQVLQMYLADAMDADDLQEWAEFVECRNDVDYSAIEGFIYALTTPELMGDITPDNVAKMQQLLIGT